MTERESRIKELTGKWLELAEKERFGRGDKINISMTPDITKELEKIRTEISKLKSAI